MDIYTRKGDDGTTGLLFGGRVDKSALGPEAYGSVDESVAALGVARSSADEELATELLRLQRELFVVGAELATGAENLHKLEAGVTRVTAAMVEDLEPLIDELVATHGMPTEFVVPGMDRTAALLDVARTAVRRAERRAVALGRHEDRGPSEVVPYLNRLADYLYMLARAQEAEWEPSRT